MSSNRLKNGGQGLVGEVSREGGGGLDEAVRPLTIRRSTSRSGDQQGPRVIAFDGEGGSWVRSHKDVAELAKNPNPNSGSQRRLVPDADTTELRRQGHRILLPEKTGIEVSNALRSLHGIEPDVEHGHPGSAASNRVRHVQDGELQLDTVGAQNSFNHVMNHLPGFDLPLARFQLAIETRSPQDGQPVFLIPVEGPIPELCVGGHLDVDDVMKSLVTALEIGQPIIVLTD